MTAHRVVRRLQRASEYHEKLFMWTRWYPMVAVGIFFIGTIKLLQAIL